MRQDYQSERFIQQTLDRISRGRTTITISHRISAIRSADRIVFIEKGVIVEDGTHSELMAMRGRYYEMITAGNSDYDDDLIYNNRSAASSRTASLDYVYPKQTFNIEDNPFKQISLDSDINKTSLQKTNDESIKYSEIIIRMAKLARPEWLIICLASIAALLIGTTFPIFSVLFGEMYGVSKIKTKLIKILLQIPFLIN